MSKPLASVTEQNIANASAVKLVDPKIPGYSLQLYGQHSGALSTRGEARQVPQQLEIEIDSTDISQIQQASRLVESIKNRSGI